MSLGESFILGFGAKLGAFLADLMIGVGIIMLLALFVWWLNRD